MWRRSPSRDRGTDQNSMATADAPPRALRWVHEDDPRWDADRERVFASVPGSVFRAEARRPGELLSSDWWRVERDGQVVGYGWLDDVWGDAEILLAVDEAQRGTGVGSFVLEHLEQEAAGRGLNYVLNVVRETHPERAAVSAWLAAHGFTPAEDGRLRKQVGNRARDIGQHQAGRPGTGRAPPPDEARRAGYTAERERAAGRAQGAAPAPAETAGTEPMG